MNGDSTVRTRAATTLNQLRNVNNRIALLWLRQAHRHLSQDEKEDLARLQAKANALNRQLTIEKYGRPQ